MFQFRRFPTYGYGFTIRRLRSSQPGFPIQISPDQWIFAPPRGFSQLIASFFGSQCQGIPLALFLAWPIENVLFARSRCELCRLHKDLEIVIVTLHPFGCCSTIKIYASVSFQTQNLSVALLHLLSIHCSVFKVRSPAFLKPDLKVQFPGL